MAMAGMDPIRFLEAEDPVEAIVMLAIARAWFKQKADLDQDLAHKIINALGNSIKK